MKAEFGVSFDGGGPSWNTLKIGAGGLITGLDIAPDGTKVVRTDTMGAYWYNALVANPGNAGGLGCWEQLVTSDSIPSGWLSEYGGGGNSAVGVWEIRVAPSNSQIFYMFYAGFMFTTSNRGQTWTWLSNFTEDTSTSPNAGSDKFVGPHMAIDPANPDIVLVGTPNALYYTTNGGSSWSTISSGAIPTPTGSTPVYAMAFDGSTTSGGSTPGIYVGSYGNGFYHTSTGPEGTWSAINSSGMPTEFAVITCENGTLFVPAPVADYTFYTYASGSWKTMDVGGDTGDTPQALTVDPSSSSRWFVMSESGGQAITTNSGSTWPSLPYGSGFTQPGGLSASDIPWLTDTGSFFDTSAVLFDPSQSNVAYMSSGVGVWYASPANNGAQITWDSVSAGIEQLVVNDIICPNGVPVVAVWDRNTFYLPDFAISYPSSSNQLSATFAATWGIDYSGADATYGSNFMVSLTTWEGTQLSSYSTNGGSTWTGFSSGAFPFDTNGGAVAVSDSQNILVAAAGGQAPWYTTNQGSTWTQISVAGVSWSSFLGDYADPAHPMDADKGQTGVYYIYLAAYGLLRSTNSGATWSNVNSSVTSINFLEQLHCTPGKANDLWLTPGFGQSNDNLYHSTNGGTTLTEISGITSCGPFGFGAPQTSGGYPTIYAACAYEGVYGFWRSKDEGATWQQLPVNISLDDIHTIVGDLTTYGRVFVGWGGSGAQWIYYP